jgi:hypothetical protein
MAYDNTVHEDEFHYNAVIAAKHADRNALLAAGKSVATEIAREERRFDAARGDSRQRLDAQTTLAGLLEDQARIAQAIEDMNETEED